VTDGTRPFVAMGGRELFCTSRRAVVHDDGVTQAAIDEVDQPFEAFIGASAPLETVGGLPR
jgi:hypothetical protein